MRNRIAWSATYFVVALIGALVAATGVLLGGPVASAGEVVHSGFPSRRGATRVRDLAFASATASRSA